MIFIERHITSLSPLEQMNLSIVIHTGTTVVRPYTEELNFKRIFKAWYICTERPLSDQWWEPGIHFRRLIWLEKPTHGKFIPSGGIPEDSVSEKELVVFTLRRMYQLSKRNATLKLDISEVDFKNKKIPIYLWHRFNAPELLDDEIVEKYNC